MVVPKVRVGPIGKYTSVQALRSLMPNAVLRHEVDRNGAKTVVLYRKTNRDQKLPDLVIRWRRKHRVISQITIFQFAGPWRTVEGIRMLTSLESVHQVNGANIPLRRGNRLLHAKSFPGGKISSHIEFGFRRRSAAPGDPGSLLPLGVHSGSPEVQGRGYRVIGIVVHFP